MMYLLASSIAALLCRFASAAPACPLMQAIDLHTAGGDLCGGGSHPPPLGECKTTASADACEALCGSTTGCCCFSWTKAAPTYCYLKAGSPTAWTANGGRESGCFNSSSCGRCAHHPPGPAPPAPPPVIPGVPAGAHYACQPPNDSHDFCDTNASFHERVARLVANLSTDELVAAITDSSGVPRLNVPAMGQPAAECLHGVRSNTRTCPLSDHQGSVCVSLFPAASGLSRTFNRTQWQYVGAAMADEGRVLFNVGITGGLWFTGPQLNIQRDPRWGRNSNSPSEDPYHTGAYGKAITEGFQGIAVHPGSPMPVDHRFVKVANMMKHWTAYSVENFPGGPGRMGFDGNISLHDLVDTYFPGMRMSAEANISSAMCSYDAINGTPSCINGWMTNSVARETWGWEGVIYTDCGALSNVVGQFKLMDAVHTAAAAIKQGTDAECDSILKTNLRSAVTQDLVSAADLRKTASRIFLLYFKLGMFDPVSDQPMARFNDTSIIAGPMHQQLALDAARESICLLQNPSLLPLQLSGSQAIASLAVVGPGANLTDAFIGEYSPVPCGDSTSACMQTVVGAIKSVTVNSNVKLVHAVGCMDGHACTVLNTSSVVAAAKDTQVTVLIIGIKPDEALNGEEKATSGEGIDRLTTGLPGRQRELCEAVIATGKPVVLVVAGGGSISVDFAKDHPHVAVLSIGAGGFAGAQALAEVIFGLVNPSGRLPHTVYRSNWQQITPMRDMSMQAGAGRSYRWLDVAASPPLWSFGDGLSYTHFALQLAKERRSGSELRYEVTVTNRGAHPGANVVLMFSKPEDLNCATPIPEAIIPAKSLVEFARTRVLPPGGTEVLRFTVDENQLGLVNEHGATVLCTGGYVLSWYDGNSTVQATHNVTVSRVVATVPQPPKQM